MKKRAFTLAEVLITLGIIGVVAAVTLPVLISNHKKKVYAQRAKQAYSLISQAIRMSELQNGDIKYWKDEFPNTSIENTDLYMKKYILPYLKAEYCGDGISTATTNKCGLSVSLAGQSYLLPNGVSVSFVPAYIKSEFLHVIIDVNTYKKPNLLGNDAFHFVYYPEKGFLPYGATANCSREDLLNGCTYNNYLISCKKTKDDNPDDLYRHGCTLLLMMDGWEFKKDYPW